MNELIKIEFNDRSLDNQFDKVLVDVPCTNDRKSLNSNDNNIFSKSRNEERTVIPKKQIELLT